MPSSQLLPRCYHVAEDRVVYLILGYSCICSSHRRLQIPLQWGGGSTRASDIKGVASGALVTGTGIDLGNSSRLCKLIHSAYQPRYHVTRHVFTDADQCAN